MIAGADAGPLRRMPLTAIAFASFVCGFATLFSFDLIGRIYLTEVLLWPAAALAFFAGGHRALATRWFWLFVVTGLLMLAGLVASDLVRGIQPSYYLRGWAKCGFLVLDVACLCVLLASDRRHLWWYALGLGLGSVVYLAAVEQAPLASWKISYAVPAAILVLCLDLARPPRWVVPALLAGIALVGLWLDARAEPAIVLLVAALHATRPAEPGRPLALRRFAAQMALPLGLVAVSFAVSFVATDADYRERRAQSSLGRALSYTLGVPAVLASPWLGNGSWNDNRELSNRQFDILHRSLPAERAAGLRYTGFSPHAQWLQAWYEGGALALPFFVVLLVGLLRALPHTVLNRPRDALTGLMLYLLLSQVWHLFMSPFNGGHRLNIMLACGVLFLLAQERHRFVPPAAAGIDAVPRRPPPPTRRQPLTTARHGAGTLR